MKRPLGLTILCILNFIGSLLEIMGGLVLIGIGGLGVAYGGIAAIFGAFGFLIGIVSVLLGLVGLFVTWGLWIMKKWAWTIAIILQIIGLILNVINTSWYGIILNLVIVVYLWYIKDVFH